MRSTRLSYENAAKMYGLNAAIAAYKGDSDKAAFLASKAATFAHAAMRCIAAGLR